MKFVQNYIEYLKDNPDGYWFKRKLYGWGWTPATWQGWALTIVFILLIVANAIKFELAGAPEEQVGQLILETVIMVGALILLCYKTGEKPRWQWGSPKESESNESKDSRLE